MHIPFRLKAAMIAAFVVLISVWSFVWSSFIHALPMWGVYVVDALLATAIASYYGKQWLDRRRSAVGRAIVGEHHFDAGPGNARLRSRAD